MSGWRACVCAQSWADQWVKAGTVCGGEAHSPFPPSVRQASGAPGEGQRTQRWAAMPQGRREDQDKNTIMRSQGGQGLELAWRVHRMAEYVRKIHMSRGPLLWHIDF